MKNIAKSLLIFLVLAFSINEAESQHQADYHYNWLMKTSVMGELAYQWPIYDYEKWLTGLNYNKHPMQTSKFNWEIHRDMIGLLNQFENISNELNGFDDKHFKYTKIALDMIVAFNRDLKTTKTPHDWLSGHTVNKIGELGLDVFIDLIKKEAASAIGVEAMPTFGLDQVFHAHKELANKGHMDIDVMTRFLDAAVGLSWGVLGYTKTMLTTGNHNAAMVAASKSESIGISIAEIGRYAFGQFIDHHVIEKHTRKNEIYEAFHSANLSYMNNGQYQRKITDMFDNAYLRKHFSNAEINNLNNIVNNHNTHIERSRANQSLERTNFTPTVLQIGYNNGNDLNNYRHETLIVGTNAQLQQFSSLNNGYNYVMQTTGNVNQDIAIANQYNFRQVAYINDHKNHHTKTSEVPQQNNYNNSIQIPNRIQTEWGINNRNEYYDIQRYVSPWQDPRRTQPVPVSPVSSNIGGVMLSNTAKLDQSTNSGFGSGGFSFIFDSNSAALDLDEYKRFITSLWSVYFDPSPPGISIDPISTNPDIADVQMVRYIGNVINNDLGRVMREADYLMKKWAVGTEKPDIEGFKDVDALMASSNINYFGASRRFWFVPEEMRFTAGDGYCIFTGGRMVLNTEYIFLDNKATQAEPADIAFAEFFTDNYDEIAEKYPIYQELYDYAKLVSLANYLKQNKIPSLWFLLANKHFVISEDSPGTVEQLVKSSEYFEGTQIVGGVDPNAPAGNYVYDSTAITAISHAWEIFNSQNANFESVNFTSSNNAINVEINERELTIVDNYALTTNSDLMGNRYQTDLSIWSDNNPGLEIVRISNNDLGMPGDFGYGWNFMRLYKIEVMPNDSVIWNNMIWKKHCTVKNLITGKVDTLVFNPEQYNYIGYSPIYPEKSEFILLMPQTNGGFELADKLGNYFVFNHNGDLSKMTLGNMRQNHWRFNIPVCNPDKYQDILYYLDFSNSYVDFGRFRVAQSVELIDRESDSKHTFSINKNSNSLEYKPAGKSVYDKLIVLNTGKFILYDLSGKQYHFDQYGCISDIISGQEYKIEYTYFDDGIDNFSKPLLNLNLVSNSRVTVDLGDYELSLPAKLSLKNLETGNETVFDFAESDTCICYLPEHQQSQYHALYLLTNGHYLAETKNGYEIYFDESGRLSALNSNYREYLKSFQQGDYIAEFSYTLLGNGAPVVDKIQVYRDLEWTLIYKLKYEYDDNGFLINSTMILADSK